MRTPPEKGSARSARDKKRAPPLWFCIFVGLMIVLLVGVLPIPVSQLRSAQAPTSDCIRGAPEDCVEGTVESAYERGFAGYIYCACVTPSGMAQGFLAANSTVHSVDDQGARAGRRPNPAVTFPVGAPHR